jgi:hypothetical protein
MKINLEQFFGAPEKAPEVPDYEHTNKYVFTSPSGEQRLTCETGTFTDDEGNQTMAWQMPAGGWRYDWTDYPNIKIWDILPFEVD